MTEIQYIRRAPIGGEIFFKKRTEKYNVVDRFSEKSSNISKMAPSAPEKLLKYLKKFQVDFQKSPLMRFFFPLCFYYRDNLYHFTLRLDFKVALTIRQSNLRWF